MQTPQITLKNLHSPCLLIWDETERLWCLFTYPVRIVTTDVVDDVLPALREVERLCETNAWHAGGFVSYEAAPAFDPTLPAKPDASFPLLWFALVEKPQYLDELPTPKYDRGPTPAPEWRSPWSSHEYHRRVQSVRDYIRRGDTYQVNLTHRLRADSPIHDPWQLFLGMIGDAPPPHAAYLDTGEWTLCSASPELFFRKHRDVIESRPMKGTAPRGRWTEEDRANAEALADSPKDRAENVMIVDMVRNDLGRIAVTGTVRVSSLFEVEQHPTVWQMTSTVEAKTRVALSEVFSALFPPASITGAPKRRTMQIIDELETSPRRVYTGTIGRIGPGGHASFNVAIRTPVVHRPTGDAEYGVGGGIVWDSQPAREAEECRTKTRVLLERCPTFDLLETLRWTPETGFDLEDQHLQRLANSARYFAFEVAADDVRRCLRRRAEAFPLRPQRVRLRVTREGACRIEAADLDEVKGFDDLVPALRPVDRSDVFLYHKTTHRAIYEQARAARDTGKDVLLFNEHGDATESTIANIAIPVDGVLATPPVCDGLLPGTMRQHLLDTGRLVERSIPLEQILERGEVRLLNSLRGMQSVSVRAAPAGARS